MTTTLIDRIAVTLEEGGSAPSVARAAAANTVRGWAREGKNYRGEDLRLSVRDKARAAASELIHETRDVGVVRLERSGVSMKPDEHIRAATEAHHRATIAEGLLMAVATPRGESAAIEFLGCKRGANLKSLLIAELELNQFLAEALGYSRATGPGQKKGTFHGMHGVQKATRHKQLAKGKGAITCVHCGVTVIPDAAICPNCQKPPASAPSTVPADTGLGSTTPIPNEPPVGLLMGADGDAPDLLEVPAASQISVTPRKGARSGKATPAKPKRTPAAGGEFDQQHPRQRGGPGGGRFIKKGDQGQHVQHAQRRLAEVMPKAGVPLHGTFDAATEQHVKDFQSKYGLPPTGKIDMATAEMMRNPPPLDRAQVAAQDAAATKSKGRTSSTRTSGSPPPTGSRSAALQLNPNDRNAVRAFQKKNGLAVTGKIDPETRAVLKSQSGGGSSAAGSAAAPKMIRRGDGMQGQADAQVSQIQQMLDDLGYSLGDAGVDGRFGEATDKALREFQQRAGLRVDGVAGDQTVAMLRRKLKALQKENQADYGTSPVSSSSTARGGGKTMKVREASYTGVGTTGGTFGTRVPYGGVPIAAIPIVPGEVPDPADENKGAPPTQPPDLREATEWSMCGNCVHFNTKNRCLKHRWPTRRDWVCNDHFTDTPEEQQHYGRWLRAYSELKEARAAGDGRRVAVLEARKKYYERKLAEFDWNPTAPGTRHQPLVEAADSMAKATKHEKVGHTGQGLWKHKGLQLPAYIQHIANDIKEKRGLETGRAIAIAIGAVKRWARGGGKVDAGTRAAAAKAVAEWEKLKLQHADMQEAELIEAGLYSERLHPRDRRGKFSRKLASELKPGDRFKFGNEHVTVTGRSPQPRYGTGEHGTTAGYHPDNGHLVFARRDNGNGLNASFPKGHKVELVDETPAGKASPASGHKGVITYGTRKYEATHGKAPRSGHPGQWAFDIGGKTVFIHGTLADAKKKAMAQARAGGHSHVEVLP